jgi:hypothetical protein
VIAMHKSDSGRSQSNLRRSHRKREREAAEQRIRRVKWLLSKGKLDPQAAKLAAKLDTCGRHNPCNSAACPECQLRTRRQTAKAFRRFLRERRRTDNILAISVVLPSSAVAPGNLHTFDAANFARRLKYLFDKASVGWVIGALDLSFNTHQTGRYADQWVVHLHGFTTAKDADVLRAALGKVLPKTDSVPRPVRVQPWDGDRKAIRYIFKTAPKRRIGIDAAIRFDKATGKNRQCRATKSQRLRSAEKIEFLLFLDRVGWEGRLFLRHAQQRTSETSTTITLMRNHDQRHPS